MDKDELWARAVEIMVGGKSPDDPRHYFLGELHPLGVFSDQFILLTNNERVQTWVTRNYMSEILEAVQNVNGTRLNINVALSSTDSNQAGPAAQAPAQSMPQQAQNDTQGQEQAPRPDWMNTYVNPADIQPRSNPPQNTRAADSYLQPSAQNMNNRAGNGALFSKCTFDTFVTGESNKFAKAAALAVAEQPGVVYNPLFIYGSSGLGKTHLLVAIANYINQNYPMMVTCYASANDFLNDYVEATQRNQWSNFNAKYHQADILLVDDVQYLEGKDETINQLFNIFNEMTNRSKQIVLSADRAPKDIDMDDRMRSRFISGMLVDIKPPDFETRLAIIKNCYQRTQHNMSFYGTVGEDVLSYLAQTAGTNIREMEGAVTRLVGHMAMFHKSNMSIDEAEEILQDFFPNLNDTQVTVAAIQAEVERFFKISHEDLISSKRSRGITYPRHIAIYLSRWLTEESLESIGRKFGGRDHTTVMHSINKIEKEKLDNRTMFDQVEELNKRIRERG